MGGHDEKYTDPTDGRTVVRSHRNFTVRIEAVGQPVGPRDDLDRLLRATDMLQAVEMSTDTNSTISRLDRLGVAIVDEGDVLDISQFMETENEPRAVLDMIFRARFDQVDDPGYFDTIEFEGEFDSGRGGNPDHSTGTITVPIP